MARVTTHGPGICVGNSVDTLAVTVLPSRYDKEQNPQGPNGRPVCGVWSAGRKGHGRQVATHAGAAQRLPVGPQGPAEVTPETERALRRVARKLAEAQQERDRLIRQAIAEGGSLRQVADAAGLTHPGVKKIVERVVTCKSCGATVGVRPTGNLASHNRPPNKDGYVTRCGNRRP